MLITDTILKTNERVSMKKYIIIAAIAFLFFGTQLNAMRDRKKEDQFRSFLNHLAVQRANAPAGEPNAAQYYKNKIRDAAQIYGLSPAQARKIYMDSSAADALIHLGMDPTNPEFAEVKAKFMKECRNTLNKLTNDIFPEYFPEEE